MPSPPPRRAWGTRYDSLIETPLSGSPPISTPEAATHPPDATGAVNVGRKSSDCDATPAPAEKERTNPDHEYPQLPPSVAQSSIETSTPMQARMPHDASVFVARYAQSRACLVFACCPFVARIPRALLH